MSWLLFWAAADQAYVRKLVSSAQLKLQQSNIATCIKMTTAALWRVLLHVRPSCACWTSIRCTAYVKKLVSVWQNLSCTKNKLFCNIFRFLSHRFPHFFSTSNCRHKRNGHACAANYCLRTSRSLVLRNQAFAAWVGFCFEPRPIKHMWEN